MSQLQKRHVFGDAITDPAKSKIYSSPSDYGPTVFIISHYAFNKFTIVETTTKKVETDSEDNGEEDADPLLSMSLEPRWKAPCLETP
jgi:hypothetical protein